MTPSPEPDPSRITARQWLTSAPALVAYALIIMFAGFVLAMRWYEWKGERYCGALKVGETQLAVLAKAKEADMLLYPPQETPAEMSGQLGLITDRAPWFRFVCRVELTEGRVTAARLEPGD